MATSMTFQQLEKRKKNRIFSAALSEFASCGYAGASINAIVERVGIAKGSIFNYFADKEGLFVFVFEQSLEKVKEHLRAIRDETREDDLFTRIEKTLLAGVAFIRSHPRIYKIYLRIHYESGVKSRGDLIRSVRRNSIKFLKELLVSARSRGEVPADLDLDRGAFLLDAVMGQFLQSYGVQHLDGELGLFKAEDARIRAWTEGVVRLLKEGLGSAGRR